jgi:hypothetical protein
MPYNYLKDKCHAHLLVKVPMTLPSSFLATESQSWMDISAATFLAVRRQRENCIKPILPWVNRSTLN